MSHFIPAAAQRCPHRTAMITGVTQTTLGSVTMRPPKQFMRPLPGEVKPLPVLMRNCGYHTGNIRDKEIGSGGKDDWNFQFDGKGWDTHSLSDLKTHQPFYAQFNFLMAHRPFKQDTARPIASKDVDLPPYYPDHSVTRQVWSDYLESIQHLDRNVGGVMEWLQREGLADNTIVFFLSDHGEAFLRGKCFLYDCGLNQPLIIRWPKACNPPAEFKSGAASDQLLAAIDITAQTVACAGGTVPDWMHGRPFLGPNAELRSEVFSAADWCGGSKLKSRSIRTERYKYIRNFNTSLSVHSASTEYRKARQQRRARS
ncbi:MAG: sulfatase-like hydrolase/transferase [Candidatus Nealsonbacteria bacterium]|nr:sulfatase-like hydrolase/transferase [Candidatus Nealsonbacteria bacterium]